MTLMFDRSTSRNRAPAPALTALVLSGLLMIAFADTQAAELAMITAQSEYGSPVSLSPEALPVRGTLDTSDLETDAQAIITRALRFQEGGDHDSASELFARAWQIARVSNGLYHQSLIPIVECMIISEVVLENWAAVNNKYDLLEHLYRRLYATDDERLEFGLQKVSSWHVNAFNSNVDGKRKQHLQQARKIFLARLEIAENTLPETDPKFAFLRESIQLTETYLYLMSERYIEHARHNHRAAEYGLIASVD
ncbi:MAG: hypothetical protein VXW46_03040 [Pseudomonadota bacterium]|nr:hypothetical protein [Pseudomonadota bacterium]